MAKVVKTTAVSPIVVSVQGTVKECSYKDDILLICTSTATQLQISQLINQASNLPITRLFRHRRQIVRRVVADLRADSRESSAADR